MVKFKIIDFFNLYDLLMRIGYINSPESINVSLWVP